MGLLGQIVRPRSSLLLLYDHLTDEGMQELEEHLAEVRKYYRFSKVSEIVGKEGGKNAAGRAAVIFQNARRSVFLRAVPRLRAEKIPFTLFLRPDCIGLNRLPPEEELAHYEAHYPKGIASDRLIHLRARAWEAPAEVEAFLLSCRREIGPLPVERLDPTVFFTTWGRILELSPSEVELGLRLSSDPRDSATLTSSLSFIRQQTGVQVKIAFSPQLTSVDPVGEKRCLQSNGMEALVTPRAGAVERHTDPWLLPCWPMRMETDEKDQAQNPP